MSGDLGTLQHRERMVAFARNFKAIEANYRKAVAAAKAERDAMFTALREFHVERGGTLDDVAGYGFPPI